MVLIRAPSFKYFFEGAKWSLLWLKALKVSSGVQNGL